MENAIEYVGYGIVILGGLIATAIAFLRKRAPKTEGTGDDRALEILERAEDILEDVTSFVEPKDAEEEE